MSFEAFQVDFDARGEIHPDSVSKPLFGRRPSAVLYLCDLFLACDQAFREEKTDRKRFVFTGSPHRYREGRMLPPTVPVETDAYLQWLFHSQHVAELLTRPFSRNASDLNFRDGRYRFHY